MTNEELKKKICKIIADNYLPKEMPDRLEDYKLYRFERAADALIAAGLKFDTVVSHTATFDIIQHEQISRLEIRVAEAEHRAEVAERAVQILANDSLDYTYDDAMEQAEKEFAEEGKDD